MTQSKEKIKIFNLNSEVQDLKKEQTQREKHKNQMNEFHNEFQSLLDHAFRPEMTKSLEEINNEKNKS
jgi:hypothetical protein